MQVASFVKAEVEEMFDGIDGNGDGSIRFDEFAALLRKMDHGRSDIELRASFNAVDADGDGSVSFDEFFAWVTRR